MEQPLSERPAIIVEFPPHAGQVAVAITPADVVARSGAALAKALDVIRELGSRFSTSLDTATNHPSQAELEFSLKFDAEVGAVIARTSQEASLNVKLVWQRQAVPGGVSEVPGHTS